MNAHVTSTGPAVSWLLIVTLIVVGIWAFVQWLNSKGIEHGDIVARQQAEDDIDRWEAAEPARDQQWQRIVYGKGAER